MEGDAAESDRFIELERAVNERDDAGVVGSGEVVEEPAGFGFVEGFDIGEFGQPAGAFVLGVGCFGGFLGSGRFEGGLGDERGIEPGGQGLGGGSGVRAGVVEGEVEAADEFGERGVGVLLVVEQELAVFEGGEVVGGDWAFFAFGGGFPGGDGFLELGVAAGELVVERGVEVSAGGVRNKLGDGGGARGWIREAFAEGIVVGVKRGAGEKEEEQVFSHGWDI